MTDISEYALRTSLAYIVVLLLTRTLGRKNLTQITLFDFVSATALGALATTTLVTHTLAIEIGLTTLIVWGCWIMAGKILSLKTVPARKFLESEPVMVIYNGKVLETNLSKTYYNVNDLLEQLRINCVCDPSEVQIGIMKVDGQLSILKKADLRTPAPVTGKFTGKELIIDGQIIDTSLRRAGLTPEWLRYELSKRGIAKAADVLLATITPAGKLYVDVKDDGLRNR